MANDTTFCNGYYGQSKCPLSQSCFRFIQNGKYLPERVFVFNQAPFEWDVKTSRTTCKFYYEK